MIHPSAIISPGAQLDSSVEVGPFAVIDRQVSIGPGCRVGPHVCLTGLTTIGANNSFHAHAVIGDAPQDVKYKGAPTGLRIGANNLFREGCTVHRSAKPEEETIIGSHNFLMVNSHVGHNVRMGDHIILANGALLGGHVVVEDRAFISGNCLVHQFVRVGRLAIMQGGSAISLDLPPFTVARGDNSISGLNTIGLRRAGLGSDERLELKQLYKKLLLSGLNLSNAMIEAKKKVVSDSAKHLLEFIASSKRGICRHHGLVHEESVSDDPGID
jgi:UDP-N-acetylglucosamine acyltransferase